MSIINEALKKTQLSRKLDMDKRAMAKEKQSEPVPTVSRASLFDAPVLKDTMTIVKQMDFLAWKRGGFIAMTILLTLIAYISYQHAKNPGLPIVQAAINPEKEKIAFTGIFVSDKSKIAVINKQSYHVGDTVKGMKIVAISQDSVDLQQDDKVIQLRAGATYML